MDKRLNSSIVVASAKYIYGYEMQCVIVSSGRVDCPPIFFLNSYFTTDVSWLLLA
jgi:hypothetical protein